MNSLRTIVESLAIKEQARSSILVDDASTYIAQTTAATEVLDSELDEFLGALTALSGNAGNVRLREFLEWDVAAYESLKLILVDRWLIVPGRGLGGPVALTGEDTALGSSHSSVL